MAGGRRLARALLPPVVTAGLERLHARRTTPEWAYLPAWPEAAGRGWAEPAIAEVQAKRLQAFVDSIAAPSPLGVSAEGEAHALGVQNTYLAFAYVLGRAALGRTGSPLTVLDWGGGLGQYSLLARSLLPEAPLAYTCHDLEPLVDTGASLVDGVRFEADPQRALSGRYDLVVASSSLHYTETWRDLVRSLCGAASTWLYVTRQPVVMTAEDYVVVQRAHRHGYPTSYPGWVLNRGGLVAAVEGEGFGLEREFLIDERPPVDGAPEPPEYRGFLFRRT